VGVGEEFAILGPLGVGVDVEVTILDPPGVGVGAEAAILDTFDVDLEMEPDTPVPVALFVPHKRDLSHPHACPFGSFRLTGSPAQYAYAFNPPFPNGLQLSALLKRINTGLNWRYPFPK
jgi:hypothetical protein